MDLYCWWHLALSDETHWDAIARYWIALKWFLSLDTKIDANKAFAEDRGVLLTQLD